MLKWLTARLLPRALDELRDELRALQKRVAELEDDLLALDVRFQRLRGTVTGAMRYDRDEREDDDEDEDDELEREFQRALAARRAPHG